MKTLIRNWPDLFEIEKRPFREVLDLQFRTQMTALRGELKRDPVEGLSVLDYGSGRSPYSDLFQGAKNFIAVDPHDGGAEYSEIPSGCLFDRILLVEVLEHLSNPQKTLRELSSKLTEGGKIWITVPFAARVHRAPQDFYRWTEDGLKQLAQNSGLRVVAIEPRGNAIGTLASKVAFLSFRCLLNPVTFLLGMILILFGLSWLLPLAWISQNWRLPVEDPLGYFLVLSATEL